MNMSIRHSLNSSRFADIDFDDLYDDEDYDDEEEEEDIDDDEEEEEDLLVDHYGEDLTREEREELMMKDIEKAQDKSEY